MMSLITVSLFMSILYGLLRMDCYRVKLYFTSKKETIHQCYIKGAIQPHFHFVLRYTKEPIIISQTRQKKRCTDVRDNYRRKH